MEKKDDVPTQDDGKAAARPGKQDLHLLKQIKKRQEYAQHLNDAQREDLTANAIILKRLWKLLKADDQKAA